MSRSQIVYNLLGPEKEKLKRPLCLLPCLEASQAPKSRTLSWDTAYELTQYLIRDKAKYWATNGHHPVLLRLQVPTSSDHFPSIKLQNSYRIQQPMFFLILHFSGPFLSPEKSTHSLESLIFQLILEIYLALSSFDNRS